MCLSVAELHPILHDLFNDTADHIATDSGFVLRKRALTGAVFAKTLTFTALKNPNPTLLDYARTAAKHLGVHVTPNAFDQRFSPTAVDFFRQLFQAAFDRSFDRLRPAVLPVLRRFAAVYLRDATVVRLPDALAELFPGRHTPSGQPTAALKVVIEVEVTTGQFTAMEVLPARANDKTAAVAQQPLPAGSLLLEDRGFFAGDRLQEYLAQGVYVLTRVPARTAFFAADGTRLDLVALLQQAEGHYVERDVFVLHHERLPLRLLAERLPEAEAAARREQVRREAKKRGRPVSAEKLALCAWHVLLTNAPAALLSVYEAGAVRRVRWQIELVNRAFKSGGGGLGQTRSRRAERVLTEVYAKLLARVVAQWTLLASGYVLLRHSGRRLNGHVRRLAGRLLLALARPKKMVGVLGRLAEEVAKCRLQVRHQQPSTFDRLAELDYDFRILDQFGLT